MVPCLIPTWIKVEIMLYSEEAISSLYTLWLWNTSDSYNFSDCMLSSMSYILVFVLTIMM